MAYCVGTKMMKTSAPSLTISDTHFAICDFLLVGRIAVDELPMDVAGIEIGGRDRHDRRRHQRADADRGKGDADEPRREAVQEQRRHREAVAELLEARREFGCRADAGGDGKEAQQRQHAEQESIARQQCGITPDGFAA